MTEPLIWQVGWAVWRIQPAKLAYRLYTICEREGWAEEAQAHNGLVVNWPDIRKHAEEFTLQ